MIVVDKALIVLGAAEIGKKRPEIPAAAAKTAFPGIIVGGISACIDLGIDGRTAAENLGLRVPQHASLHVALGDRRPPPTCHALRHLGEPSGNFKKQSFVASARLKQQ